MSTFTVKNGKERCTHLAMPNFLLNTHELAWAAGFFDGEGYIHTSHRKRNNIAQRRVYSTFAVDVRQVDRRVLDRFQAAVGVGKVRGPYKQTNPNAKPAFTFSVGKFEEVQHVIACLWNWLSPVKRAQCKTALVKFLTRPHLTPGRKKDTTYPQ